MIFYAFFTMFNNVLRCLVSHALATRQLPIATGIANNATWIGDNAAKVVTCFNSFLNGDWNNSVSGRQFPKGPHKDLRHGKVKKTQLGGGCQLLVPRYSPSPL